MHHPSPRPQVTFFDDCCCCFPFAMYVSLCLFICFFLFPISLYLLLLMLRLSQRRRSPVPPEAPTQMAPKAGRNGTQGPGGDDVGESDSPMSGDIFGDC